MRKSRPGTATSPDFYGGAARAIHEKKTYEDRLTYYVSQCSAAAYASYQEIQSVWLHLTDREARILLRRYGHDGQPETLNVIAQDEGINRERIPFVHDRAIRTLRAKICVRRAQQRQQAIRKINLEREG